MEAVTPLVEQRTHRRILMEVTAGVSLAWRHFGFFSRKPQFSCTTRNVSVRGMQIMTDRLIPPGATLKLWVNPLTKEPVEPLKLSGEVCWSTPHSSTGRFLSGVRLHDRPEGNFAVWTENVRSLIRQHFKPVVADQQMA